MIERAAQRGLRLELKAYPHMLRLRLCARQQGARHAGDSRMVGAPVDHVDRGLYGAGAEPV